MPNMPQVNGCSETKIVPESLSFAVAPGFFVGWHEVKRKQRPPGADAAGSVKVVCSAAQAANGLLEGGWSRKIILDYIFQLFRIELAYSTLP